MEALPTPEELEDTAAEDATRALRKRLEEITARGVALFDSLEAGQGREGFRRLLASSLESLADSEAVETISYIIEESAYEAFTLARKAAAADLGIADEPVTMSGQAGEMALRAVQAAQDELRAAARQMETADDSDDVLAAFGRARRAVTRTEAAARFTVNRSLSEGTRAVTDDVSVHRLWVPERDACVHCLAYAGEVAGPGEDFRGGLTFGAKPLVPASGSVPDAPLHPNCRCRVVVWRTEWDPGDGTGRPAALKREALRSVLRGFSLPSESERVRLDAASRALARAGHMPKSVQEYARRAVRQGSFSRGRALPVAKTAARKPSVQRKQAVRKSTALRSDSREVNTANRYLERLPKQPAGAVVRHWMDKERVNPNFRQGVEWQVNCQRATVAYELRRRGYEVQAEPNYQDNRSQQYPWNTLNLLWRTASGAIRQWLRPHTADELEGIVAGWPPGSRGWLGGQWNGQNSAHIWNVEVDEEGTVHWIDAQTNGSEIDVFLYLRRLKPGNLYLMRVDDLLPASEEMTTMVRSAR